MKDFIQRYSQQQIARFLTLALIPAVLAGTIGLIASYFMATPAYAVGLYVYLGYRSIGWKSPSIKKAKRIWTWSIVFNALLFLASLLMLIEGITEYWGDFWAVTAVTIYALCVGAISLTSYYTRQTVGGTQEYEGVIEEMGLS